MDFINIVIAYPTVVYTVLLGLALFYWFFVILGVLDLDILHLHFDFDIDMDVDVDVDMDVDLDADVDGGSGPGFLMNMLVALGVGRVPITIIYSAVVFAAWVISYIGATTVLPLLGNAAWAQTLVLIGSFLVALPVSGIVTRPLQKVFEITTKATGKKLVGAVATVLTSSVDAKFGQARIDDGGAGLVVNIRNEHQVNGLRKGSQALIIGYDEDINVYHVEPMDNLLLPSDDAEIDVQQANVAVADQVAQTVD